MGDRRSAILTHLTDIDRFVASFSESAPYGCPWTEDDTLEVLQDALSMFHEYTDKWSIKRDSLIDRLPFWMTRDFALVLSWWEFYLPHWRLPAGKTLNKRRADFFMRFTQEILGKRLYHACRYLKVPREDQPQQIAEWLEQMVHARRNILALHKDALPNWSKLDIDRELFEGAQQVELTVVCFPIIEDTIKYNNLLVFGLCERDR
ncbi:MAG: hypothetical protein L3J02_03840 [Henriciella sp.]|nr:hypothetical protein [Henriciella sp.]